MAALWLDEDNNQKIVHLGSGSGSTMTCVLADDPIDFIRLLAIGYDEICWNDAFSHSPNFNHKADTGDLYIHPNTKFQAWVKNEFDTSIPRTALDIIKHPANMDDKHSQDPFWCWLDSLDT